MGYNLLDEGTEVNRDVSVDEELSKNSGNIEENNSLNGDTPTTDIIGAKTITPDTAKIESAKQLEQNEAAVT